MALEQLTNNTAITINNLTSELASLTTWLQAVGIILLLWIIFNIISILFNQNKKQRLKSMEVRLMVIEEKLDKLLKRR